MQNSDDIQTTYKLELKGEGVTVSRDVSEDEARQIIAIVMGGAAVPAATRRLPVGAGGSAPGGGPSLREFIDAVGVKRNPEKILAIGGYLMKHLGHSNFSREDVKGQFKNAGEGTPGNYGRDFRWAITAGWIAPDPEAEGRFFVTSSGWEAVDQHFPDEIRRKTRQGKGSRRRQRTVVKKASG